jgi:hypothetical protein
MCDIEPSSIRRWKMATALHVGPPSAARPGRGAVASYYRVVTLDQESVEIIRIELAGSMRKELNAADLEERRHRRRVSDRQAERRKPL